MNRKTLIFVFIAILTLCFASMAQAQATRTWVSGVGDDVNPCSRTAPCKTFAGAISKTATGGEISVLDPGGYGGITITKAITINGDGTLASILASLTTGIIINAPTTANVTIRNISIHGAGNGLDGIRILAAGNVNIENVHIQGFTQQGIQISPSAAGLVLHVNVLGSQIRHVTQQGIQVLPSGTATVKLAVTDSVINNCGLGGIDIAANNNTASVTRTTLSDCNPGAQVQLATSTMMLDSCLIANNATAGITAGVGQAAIVRVHNSTISGNAAAIAGNGTVVGFFSNMVIGNGGTNLLSSSSNQQ